MRWRLATTLALTAGAVVPVAPAAAHDCTKEAPFCDNLGTLVQKKERQSVKSAVLGHHCFFSHDEPADQRDNRTIERRIEVTFRDVTRKTGFLETITLHFLGEHNQVPGRIAAFAKDNDFDTYDDRKRSPGQSETYTVNKKVRFGDSDRKEVGSYSVKNWAATEGAVDIPEAPGRPPPNWEGGRGGGTYVECLQTHQFTLRVVPPSAPPCNKPPPGPCID